MKVADLLTTAGGAMKMPPAWFFLLDCFPSPGCFCLWWAFCCSELTCPFPTTPGVLDVNHSSEITWSWSDPSPTSLGSWHGTPQYHPTAPGAGCLTAAEGPPVTLEACLGCSGSRPSPRTWAQQVDSSARLNCQKKMCLPFLSKLGFLPTHSGK